MANNGHGADCLIAADIASNGYYILMEWLHIATSLICMCLLALTVHLHLKQSTLFHKNLKIVLAGFAIAIFLRDLSNLVNFVSSQVRYWTHSDPCSLLTVGWVVLILRQPRMFFTIGMTLTFVAVVVERACALRMAKYYEAHRPVLGILLLAITLTIDFSFTIALYLKYPINRMHYVVDTLTETKEIPGFAQYVYYLVFIVIDLAALVGLYVFGRINAKKKSVYVLRRTGHNYTLRESYQLSENVAFVKIFIPVATAYFLLNTGCHFTAVLVRNFLTNAGEIDKIVWIETQYLLYIMSTIFCLSVYAYRLWKHKSMAFVRIEPMQDEGRIYFDQFRAMTEGVTPAVVF